MTRPPLLIHLLAHPDSTEACKLADNIQARFFGAPASGALRVPVLLTPQREDHKPPTANEIDLEAADHVLVVILADSRMTRTVRNSSGPLWQQLAQDLCAKLPLGSSPHLLLPLALDDGGFDLLPDGHMDRCIKTTSPSSTTADKDQKTETAENQEQTILFHIAARALQLLSDGKVPAVAPEDYKAPLTLFLSHAKKDLSADCQDPVRACKCSGLQVEGWFDSEQLTPGQNFAAGLERAVKSCSMLISFYTDVYESRPWCRREVLTAKTNGVPILLINMLRHQESRHFPYVGNTATICWDYGKSLQNQSFKILAAAALEALRITHNEKWLAADPSFSPEQEIPLGQSPEALTLVRATGEKPNFLYPDPPLDRQEQKLLKDLRPDIQIRTPLQSLRPQGASSSPLIAVSLSDSADAAAYGLSQRLWPGLVDEIHLYLLMAGYRIGYGGALSGVADATNFTHRLFALVENHYHPLCEQLEGRKPQNPVVNYVPWPLFESYDNKALQIFRRGRAEPVDMRAPLGFPNALELFPLNEAKLPLVHSVTTGQQRAAWACGLTAMRRRMTNDCQARIVMGGKLEKFSGILPGIPEEAWLSLREGKPLYLLGGFGGAARALCDLLLGQSRPEFAPGWNEGRVPHATDAVRICKDKEPDLPTLAQIGEDFAQKSGQDLGSTLNNGLTDAENRVLMTSIDARTIGRLLLQGLSACAFPT